MNARLPEAALIGAGIVDIPLVPVCREMFDGTGSHSLERIALGVGGDALNEAMLLSRLGHPAMLISAIGEDAAGDVVLRALDEAGVDRGCVVRRPGLDTGINIVTVRGDGERGFITSRTGSLRRLSLSDILPALETPAFAGVKVACLASLFVSEALTIPDMTALFDAIREKGKLLCADATRRKHGETLREAGGMLSRLDYFFPNLEEAALLTGADDPDDAADALLGCGVGRVAIKLGARGCLLKGRGERHLLPAFPGAKCVDTTGAGDTFAAAFIAGLLEGRSFADCGRLANAAASLCVEHVGANAGTWTRRDVEERLGSRD